MMGQQDISEVVSNYQSTKSDIISKGRNLLLDEYLADNLDLVNEVFLYLNNDIEDENYKPFYLPEKVLLACWTRNYEIALKEILYFDSIGQLQEYERKRKIYPNSDLLWSKVQEKSYLYKESIYSNINSSDLTYEEKEVLILVVMQLIENKKNTYPELRKQEEINNLSDEFLEKYPNSEYEHFIRYYIRLRIKSSDWGFGYSFSLGYFHPVGNYFSSSFSLGLNIDLSYKNFVLLMGYNINGGHLKKDILFDKNILWPENAKNRSIIGNISLGYRILNNDYFSIIPFIGFGGYSIYPIQTDIDEFPDLEKKEINNSSLAFGLKFDYNPFHSEFLMGLRFTYYTPTRKRNNINNDIFTLTFDIGGFYNRKKRVF